MILPVRDDPPSDDPPRDDPPSDDPPSDDPHSRNSNIAMIIPVHCLAPLILIVCRSRHSESESVDARELELIISQKS